LMSDEIINGICIIWPFSGAMVLPPAPCCDAGS
jgi:hypothetical protein